MNPFQYKEPMYFSVEIDLLIIIAISMLGIVVNRKFLKDMKDDERKASSCLINDVMRFRTKSIIFAIPASLLFQWSLTLSYHFPEWFYQVICYEQYYAMFGRFYFGFTSLIISLMRYFFIVYNEKALLLGKERVKKFFEFLSIMVPLIMLVLHACTLPVPPTAYNIAHRTCHKFLEVSQNMTCRDQDGITDRCAPILSIVLEKIPKIVTDVIGSIVKIMYIIMCSNIVEGILYWRTFKMIRQ